MAKKRYRKILVTGGAGFVGSVLVPMMLERGYWVRVVDNLMYGGTMLLPHFINPHFELVVGDITDEGIVRECLADMDAVIHLAAIVGYPACRKNPQLAKAVNVDGTRNLCRERGKDQPIIFASTGSNYGKVEGVCTEETPLNPISEYGVNKTQAEKRTLEAGNSLVYRFATAFGLSPRLRLDLMINDFCYQALTNKQLIVYERHFRRSFVHVRDMARGFIYALENFANMKDSIYNVGHESMNYTKEDVALLIKKHIDYYLHFADIGEDEDKRDYEVSYENIRKAGFNTEITMEEGLIELIKGVHVAQVHNPYSNI